MNVSAFDVIGPSMVGPSSSHTAGAARIGLAARLLLGEPVASVQIDLHGSFAATGKGHATDRALLGGLLGMNADDVRLKDSLAIAADQNLSYTFAEADLGDDSHPNSVRIAARSAEDQLLTLVASSIGGGMIKIYEVDGYETRIKGELDTVVLWNLDQPGYLATVTSLYECAGLNVAAISLSRRSRGESALTVIQSDGALPPEAVCLLGRMPATCKIRSVQPGWRVDE